MSLASVGTAASQSQSLGNLLLQQLNALNTSSPGTSTATATTATTGDQLTVSPAAQQLANLLSRLQSGNTLGNDGSPDSRSALLTALMNGQSHQSNPASLLKLLNGPSNQDSLFTFLGNSDNAANENADSLLG